MPGRQHTPQCLGTLESPPTEKGRAGTIPSRPSAHNRCVSPPIQRYTVMASTPWVLNVNARVKIWQGYDVTAALSPLGAGLPPDYDGPCQVLTPLTGGVTPFIAAPISPVFLGRLVLLNGTLNNASGLSPGMFYFFPVFSIISPFWLFKAAYNTVLKRKPSWR